MEHYIKGNFRKSIYKNDSGYVIGIFKVKETNDEELIDYMNRTITFTGYFHELNEEDTYLFFGDIITHERYGEQFQVTRYERVLPEERDSIVDFLASGLFKGIGEKKAKKIVDVLGKDTLAIILENPDNLLLIPTITKKQVDVLHNTLRDYEASYTTILTLNELGFSTKDSMMIYRKFREKTMEVARDNIYIFWEKIEELKFKKIDAMALKQGYKRNDPRRVMATILYVMGELTNLIGHSYFLDGEIYDYLKKVLGIELIAEEYDLALKQLILDTKVINKDEKYYLANMFDAEKSIANRLRYLSSLQNNVNKKLDKIINDLELMNEINYNDDQRRAIKESFVKNTLVITGGPGTGKTTIIKAIANMYQILYNLSHEKLVERIALLAPTGRASKRIAESTLLPAVTIHRFLKWNKETNLFAINEYNKSEVDFVIVDEASMIDVTLFAHLLKGLKFDTKIILVGDENQLPSVGPGQILKDIIESEEVPVVKLEKLYRQGEDSNIISLAYDINNNKLDNSIFNKHDDLLFLPSNSMMVRENLHKVCMQYKDVNIKSFQVLAPMYKTLNGIDELNVQLQAIFNPKSSHKKEVMINGCIFREDDKVIQLTNMPEDNVFNGDIGRIISIENGSKKQIVIDFDGNEVKYTPSSYQKFKHAYAISIHKSQGSEFDTVVIPIVKSYHKMLYRKLIYTAVTRTKKKLIMIGELDAFLYAIHHNEVDMRRSTLKEMLKRSIN